MKTALEEEEGKRDKALEMLNNKETELNKTHELKTAKASVLFFVPYVFPICFFFQSIHLNLDGNSIHMILIFPQAAERENAEAQMHQALKALDHHQLQLDLAIEALQAASLEVAEAKDKKKILEKEHGRFDDLMGNTRKG